MNYDICVFGICSLDCTFYPDERGKYSDKPQILSPGGKGSNQAVASSRAGSNVTIVTKIGKDKIGKKILDNLINNGVDVNNVEIIDGLKNNVSNIYINKETKDNDIKRIASNIEYFTPDVVKKYKDVILNSKLVLAQMKVSKEFSVALINFCYDNKIPIVITPCQPQKLYVNNPKDRDLLNKMSLITCNRKECEKIFGTNDIESCVKMYPNKLIVTMGTDGVIYYDGQKIKNVEAPNVDMIKDTTGAGDTFTGNLVSNLLRGDSLYNSIYKAQFASTMKLRKKTAQAGMPYDKELEKYIKEYNKK